MTDLENLSQEKSEDLFVGVDEITNLLSDFGEKRYFFYSKEVWAVFAKLLCRNYEIRKKTGID